jgi:LAS superfamily LD-carboxypeptidase LdcB
MAAAAHKDGIELQVSSGFRTQEEQLELFRLYRQGRGPLASRPGTSNHQSGHALDIETRELAVRLWLRRHAHRFGFLRTVPSERWHWEYW